jgi:hypothetical protein
MVGDQSRPARGRLGKKKRIGDFEEKNPNGNKPGGW